MSKRVPLACPSRHWGFATAPSGTLEARCRGKFCKTADGGAVVHVFTLNDGSHRTYPEGAVIAGIDDRQEDTGNARNANL